ncbi:hypothetical protein [Paraburkholderia megapolitana]|uniref:Tetratricopeptide repeat-containing protein n=1 Tax=Paraburkholderia megapolitana TaxID=420953 RepID=A0A1I3UG76_9BURK|nr:hypothetical protein [Paraburkholderia megapolitana]QDQ83525.1 hypothetical protein FNZ07_20300 [Paraburkholderia megapolitana]SFJ81689.1 hypothetical protein SAMN05192543_111159 [Paraburkholderia megapolitana]
MTIADDLSLLMQNHDDEPQAAAAALHGMVDQDVPADQLGRFTWLVDHVIGEKFGHWSEAHELIEKAISRHTSLPQPALRHAAVAAHLSGNLLAGIALERRMVQDRIRADQATIAVRASAISFSISPARALEAAVALLSIAGGVEQWNDASGVDAAVAASLNNAVSALIELDDETLGHADVRAAMVQGAAAARMLWQRAGTWVNHERADYLCALVFNRIADYANALEAAERGRQLIETNGSEDVDRAFLLLESARALIGLSRKAEGVERLRQAEAIARGWDDVGLTKWFNDKAKPVRDLAG